MRPQLAAGGVNRDSTKAFRQNGNALTLIARGGYRPAASQRKNAMKSIAFLIVLVVAGAVGAPWISSLDRSGLEASVKAPPGELTGVIRKIEVISDHGSDTVVKGFVRKSGFSYVWMRFEGADAKAVLARFDRYHGLDMKADVNASGVVERMDFKEG